MVLMLVGAATAAESAPNAADDVLTITPGRPAVGRVELPTRPGGRSAWALGMVLVAIPIGLAIARKVIPGLATRPGRSLVRVVGQCPLGPKGTVFAVRCGPRLLIVGATGSHLNTLAEFADPDEVDEFLSSVSDDRSPRPRTTIAATSPSAVDGIRGQLREIRDQVRSWNADG
jgi:flagellar biogenesis protein FliO